MERKLEEFLDRVKSSGTSDEISSEYNVIRAQTANLKQGLSFTTEAGGLKDNIKKNRYKDILPYDQTRVILKPLENEFESDYINASFIRGAMGNKKYIATQGPLSHTLSDFWRMVWQYDVKVIAMACREVELGKRKCESYWPAHTETATFGPFVISNLEEFSPNEEMVVRVLQVKYQDESRTVSQFQYTAWPDHGIPDTSCAILEMMDMVRQVQRTDKTPILIHCSAGCGRTGVICAVDYVHDLLLAQRIKEDFSIMEIVTVMRKQRPSAVQTKEQYEFLHHTVAQMFQKFLQTKCDNGRSLTENRLHLYDNVESLNRQQLQTQPHRSSTIPPKSSKTKLQSQRSHPCEQKMNDTYAVINKPKQRSSMGSAPPARTSPPTVHHYDNVGRGTLNSPSDVLYSAVKPKNHCGGAVPAQSTQAPTYAQVSPRNSRGAEASSVADQGDYEHVSGVFSVGSRNTKVTDTHITRNVSSDFNSTDDDYEYVTNPIKNAAAYCSPGGMGFNCRIKKPKGPRDPPAEWSRAER